MISNLTIHIDKFRIAVSNYGIFGLKRKKHCTTAEKWFDIATIGSGYFGNEIA